jgi:hypothetical protein
MKSLLPYSLTRSLRCINTYIHTFTFLQFLNHEHKK